MLKMGGLKSKIPITFWTFLVGTLAICGIPPLSGMISKDEILVALYAKNQIVWLGAMLCAGLTATYMFRLLFLTFFGKFRGTPEQENHLHESTWVMLLPLVILSILAVLGGGLNLPHFIAHGEFQLLAQWLRPILVAPAKSVEISFLEEFILLGLTISMVVGVFFWSKKVYLKNDPKIISEKEYISWEKLSSRRLYIDEFYQILLVKPILFLGKILAFLDKKFLDKINDNIGELITQIGLILRRLQNGRAETYLLLMSLFIGVLLFLTQFL